MKRTLLTTLAIARALMCLASTQTRPPDDLLQDDALTDMTLELEGSALESLHSVRDVDVHGRLIAADNSPVPVTVRLKGQRGSKRSIDSKPALRMKVLDGKRVMGLEHLTLNNMVQDQTMLHEAIGYQVYAAGGVRVPETSYVRLAINGEPRGVYLLVETIDRHFLKRRFGDDTGVLYEGSYGTDLHVGQEKAFELDEGEDPGRKKLSRLTAAVAAAGDALFYGDGRLVDTTSFLSMMASAALIADWDNYAHANNYRIYWSPRDARWFFIPTGLDQTFVKDDTSVFDATGLLFQKCLESRRCRADYIAAVRDAADRFERLDLQKQMDRLLSVIEAASHEDPKRPYSGATMRAAREKMRLFIGARPAAIRSSLGEPTGWAGRNGDPEPTRAPSPNRKDLSR